MTDDPATPLEAALIANGSMLLGYLLAWGLLPERPPLPVWMVVLWLVAFAWGYLS